jgi:large subunit ribosomal protein L25
MATILDLTAENRKRNGTRAVGRLRREGGIPAVIYGRGRESANIKVDGRTFSRILEHSASDNILVSLKIEGQTDQLALVQEVQHDHLRGGILHVDFHAVKEDEEIHADVPVELVGTPEGLKMGGVLEYIHHSIHVRCLPKDLPDRLTADVGHLKLGEALHVKEITLPPGVTTRLDGDVVIAMVAEPKVEAEPEPAAAVPAAAAAAPAAGAAPAAAADKAKK